MQVGKYELIRELAIGGMAEVFLARTSGPMGFEKQLVLKRILPHLAKDPAFVEMFLSEATLAARLTHPNIVQMFDFGEAEGAYFLAMEYIDGPTLRALLDDAYRLRVALPVVECARIIAHACEGLAFAHDFKDAATRQPLGIVHRDISPDNILLSRQGGVKVADFGIAKATGQRHRTQTGIIKGKLAYMPPEQVRAQPLDRRVDVYALGVVFYELLTGQRPFQAPTDASLMQCILFEQATPATHHQPDLPQAVQDILQRALAKDREQRYPDCLAFQADLEQFILSTGRPVTTQHIAQLVARISPPLEDAPLPSLPLDSPPLEDTAVRPSIPPTPLDAPYAPTAQLESTAAPAASVAPTRRSSGRLGLALAGLGLLAAGGGFVGLRSQAPLPTAAPPAVAELPAVAEPPALPAATPAEPAPVAPAEQGSRADSERMGLVHFDIKPGGVISLQGKRLGAAPLGPIQMPSGTYNFMVTNKRLKKQVDMRVEVKADDVTYVHLDLLSDAGALPSGDGSDSPAR